LLSRAPRPISSTLAIQAGTLQRDLGRGEPALASFSKAHEAAADDRQRAAAMIGMAAADRMLGRVADGLQLAEALGPMVERIGDDEMAAEFFFLRGNLAFSCFGSAPVQGIPSSRLRGGRACRLRRMAHPSARRTG
jgi:hypothetical protein